MLFRSDWNSIPMTTCTPSTPSTVCRAVGRPNMYLVITNISKRNNVKSLIRTATACGCAGIFMVGRQRQRQEQEQQFNASDRNDADVNPSLTITSTTPVIHFEKWKTCVQYLMEQDIVLVGVEIHPDAVNLDVSLPFCPTPHILPSLKAYSAMFPSSKVGSMATVIWVEVESL